MDPKKTQPGQKFQFSASLYNDLIDVVKWAKTQRGLAGAGQTGMRSNATTVLVKNQSGGAVPQFGCLEIYQAVGSGTDFENLKALRCRTVSNSRFPVVIVQQPVQNNELVEAVVVGATIARVDVTEVYHLYAEPQINSDTLVSGDTGRFRLLTPATETGVQNILVRYEPAERRSHLLIQAPPGGIPGRYQMKLGKAECLVWRQDQDPDVNTDDDYLWQWGSLDNVTVYNWTTKPVCETGDRYGVAAWCNDHWYIVAEDCADEGSEMSPMSTSSRFGDFGNPLNLSGGSVVTTAGFGYSTTTTTATVGA